MPVIEGSTNLKTAEAEYDFAKDGGAVSTITLRGVGPLGGNIPNGSVITGGYIDVETAVVSATGTVAVNSEAAGDLFAAGGAATLTLGRKSLIPAFTGASSVKTTAARNIAIAIATAALTAGKFRVVVFYK